MMIFVFPVSRRASSAAGKETSMTDLESKAQTTPSTQTSPADVDKPEVDLQELADSQILTMFVG